jgi:hypothetical protein
VDTTKPAGGRVPAAERAPELDDPDWLRRRYHAEGASMRALGDELGVSRHTVGNYLNHHGIETRPPGAATEL